MKSTVYFKGRARLGFGRGARGRFESATIRGYSRSRRWARSRSPLTAFFPTPTACSTTTPKHGSWSSTSLRNDSRRAWKASSTSASGRSGRLRPRRRTSAMAWWKILDASVLLLCTSMYLGTGWSLVLFSFPSRAQLTVDNYYEQFVPAVVRATRFFTWMTMVMMAAAIVLIVADWHTAYVIAPAVVLAGVIAATALTIKFIFRTTSGWRPTSATGRAAARPREVDPPQLDPRLALDGPVGRHHDLVRGAPRVKALWLRWRSDPLRWTLFAIAAGTFLSGLLLIVLQRWILDLLSARRRRATGSSSGSSDVHGDRRRDADAGPAAPSEPARRGLVGAPEAGRVGSDVARRGAFGLLVLRDHPGRLRLLLRAPRDRLLVATREVRRVTLVFFFGYVLTLVVAGAWGLVGARVDMHLLLRLHLGDLPHRAQANLLSQYASCARSSSASACSPCATGGRSSR